MILQLSPYLDFGRPGEDFDPNKLFTVRLHPPHKMR
jgi:hypothetical protein